MSRGRRTSSLKVPCVGHLEGNAETGAVKAQDGSGRPEWFPRNCGRSESSCGEEQLVL